MRSLSWSKILYVIAFALFAAAIVSWILTFTGWLVTEPGFEPLNALAGAIVSSLGAVLAVLRARKAKDTAVLGYRPASTQAERNRHAMLESVRNIWVKGMLEQSLHGAVMIELGIVERAEAVERPWDMVLHMPGQPNRPIPRGTKMVEVFDDMNQALLILGAPGSGKTTMLLDLARDAIARAETDPKLPIPVVFHLSSWAQKRQPLSEWLVDELHTYYDIPKKLARPWVENDELLLLLDGLDEVKREYREDCVKVVNDFRQEHLVPLAVCCRIAVYEALTAPLRLQGAVLLQPLTHEQVIQYLDEPRLELSAVRQALYADAALREMAQSPLMLSIMTLAYRGMSDEGLETLGSVAARREHLFDAYVRGMFERRGKDHPYPPDLANQYLTWLAQGMTRHSQTQFLIERLQPAWLKTDTQWRLYRVNVGLFCALIFGLIDGLLGGLIVGLLGGLSVGLLNGLLGGLLGGLSVGLFNGLFGGLLGGLFAIAAGNIIKPTEVLKWSWPGRDALIIWLLGGLLGGRLFVRFWG